LKGKLKIKCSFYGTVDRFREQVNPADADAPLIINVR